MTEAFRLSVKFWGVRGSIPTPQRGKLKVGGNTACVEVRIPGEEILILDGGTGIRDLGLELLACCRDRRLDLKVFFSHFHWDHIQGVPFFDPLYRAENRVCFYSSVQDPRGMLLGQMQLPYFPVTMDVMAAEKEFFHIGEVPIDINDTRVEAFPLNHPQGATGFRIEREGAAVVYATDLEHGNPNFDGILRERSKDADILIYDSQYDADEYEKHRGWGHSTWLEGTRVARDSGVKKLVLFHHDPSHDDDFCSALLEKAREVFPPTELAVEGLVLKV